jgi:nucleoside-diphosphate-sugar epimerase
MVPWWDDSYDKIQVEQAIMSDPDLPGTILRLPMIYGPGDYARRFHPVLKRIDDRRAFILYEQGWPHSNGHAGSPLRLIGRQSLWSFQMSMLHPI